MDPFSPQHWVMPVVVKAHACWKPALTCSKDPIGASVWPKRLSPQQMSVVSGWIPQLNCAPDDIRVNPLKGGGVD